MNWGNCLYNNDVPTISCVPALIGILIKTAYLFAGIVAVFFIIYAGFKYITSGGDPKQASGAQQTLTYALIGLIVIILSFLIIQFISTITSVDCILQIGFTQCSP